LQNVVSNL